MDSSLPGSSVHEILQARILEWSVIYFSRVVFPTQESNPGCPHCQQILFQLSYETSSQNMHYYYFLDRALYARHRSRQITVHFDLGNVGQRRKLCLNFPFLKLVKSHSSRGLGHLFPSPQHLLGEWDPNYQQQQTGTYPSKKDWPL